MFYKLGLVFSLALFSGLASGAVKPLSPQIADASFVSVNIDGTTYQCTPGGVSGGSGILISGSYKNLAGNDLCPQSARATVSNGLMTSVTLSFLSPCSGGSSTLTCSGAQCTGDGNTLTVISSDMYYFLNSNGLGARFQLN